MKKWIAGILIFLFFFQLSFWPALFYDFRLNLILAWLAVVVAFVDFKKSFGWFILGGLLFDYFSSGYFGAGVLTFLIAGLVIEFIHRKFISDIEGSLMLIGYFALFKIVFDLTFVFLNKILVFFYQREQVAAAESFSIEEIWGYILRLAVFVLVAVILRKVFIKIRKITGNEDDPLKISIN